MKVVGPTDSTETKDCNGALLKITHINLDNLDETNKSLETQNLLKLNHKEVEKLNRPITIKDNESLIKNPPIKREVWTGQLLS